MENSEKEKRSSEPIRIIACGVFRDALKYIQLKRRYPHIRLTFLPSNLHVQSQELRECLLNTIVAAKKEKGRVICLYGDCFPEIDDCCRQHGVIKVSGAHCYEIFLGNKCFQGIMDEMAGTYFLEKNLILNFKKLCLEPLELNDDEMRMYYFQHYQRLLYLRQPTDSNLLYKAGKLAKYLGLQLEVLDVDYTNLEGKLVSLV